MVDYIRSDLEFILKQIKIAEAHAANRENPAEGQPLFGPGGSIPSYNIAWGLRTVDGSYNHLLPGQEYWGAADQEFPELMEPEFRTWTVMMDHDGDENTPEIPVTMTYQPGYDPDGPGTFAEPGDVIDTQPRTISNLIVDQTLANPVAIMAALQRNGTEGDHLAIAATITAAFEPIEGLFADVTAATLAAAEAQALADANPGDTALAEAAAAAQAALVAAETALDAARGTLDGLLAANGIEMDGENVKLLNVAPDEGLSASFNSWFTLFGQFFDHGLDLVNKGGNGTVLIPLQPDDPLYVEGSPTNFMVLTRATTSPGADGVLGDNPMTPGVDESADDGRPVNTTTSFVDQNQTYTSHPSHQVFLRQYVLNADGDPVATGRLIEGANGGMANWGEVKAQAANMLGILLTDADVGKVPLMRTDPYGNFIAGANGFPQLILGIGADGIPNTADDIVVEGDPTNPINPTTVSVTVDSVTYTGAIRTSHAFLADIAHTAVPEDENGLLVEDGDIEIGGNIPADGEYDGELLNAHFIAGDGRANENIGLTAVHHVFHSEHNRLVEHTKEVILATGDNTFIEEWLIAGASAADGVSDLEWNGERLFQAAKFGTEMQYQHLVFEEFARKVAPTVNTFLVPDGFDTTMDPTIVAEFAHVVYRFGHSMLTESIDRLDPDFAASPISLIEGFLNPTAFNGTPGPDSIDDEIAAGAVIRGMTRQVGNEIDEFVTSALRNNLLGLPLDLATINLARGRDTGVPSLNEARRTFYDATNQDVRLQPYESWVDFAGNLKHEASVINFIAAYGTHELITGQTTIDGKRDAALTIITGVSFGGLEVPADAEDFLNGLGAYSADLGGLENVDLWIGGLAEKTMPFGGMLGSTFNFVFEVQMELLQSGDRFYYLQRLDGLHLFGEMENNSFAGLIMRNTDAAHLPSDVFSTPGLILEVDQSRQYNPNTGVFLPGADGVLGDDPLTPADESLDDVVDTGADPVSNGLLTQLVIRNNPSTPGPDTNYLRYTGGDHVLLGGTEAADILIAGIGDDTLYGDGDNDRLQGGFGNDILNGGDGDDIIADSGGDDNIKAGSGNDVVHAGPGLDLVLGGAGKDFIFLGTDEGSEVFAGEGDDFIYGNKNAERILGNEGNDWIETGTFDGAPGDNFDEIFAEDRIDGHDVFLGDGGFDEFIGEGGDDIMVGSPGRGKMAGMSGFDWATYKDNTAGVNADLSIPIVFDEAPQIPGNAALDEYASMEGLSGSAHNDTLRGTNLLAADRLPGIPNGGEGLAGSALDADGIALIGGLQELLGVDVTAYSEGDIILGGDGNDVIEGLAGDDVIDGDKWLDVYISVSGNPNVTRADSMTELSSRMFSGEINPSQLSIVREIVAADGAGDLDTAVFGDVFANYTITLNTDGSTTVTHVTVSDGLESDGSDRLLNIEELRFSDLTINITPDSTGQPAISDTTPTEGQALTVNTGAIADPDGLGPFNYQWQSSPDGLAWSDIAGQTGTSFTPDNNAGLLFGDHADLHLRVVVRFVDGTGINEVSISAPTAPVGVDWDGNGVANTLNGTRGDDVADAGGGNDTLNGNAGNDDLDGDANNDTITGGAGNDLVNGDTGTDTAVFTGPVWNYSFALVGGNLVVSNTIGSDGTDTLQSIENLQFGAQVLELIQGTNGNNAGVNGNTAANLLLGHDGNDIIDGGTGNDVAIGGAGNDTINWDANAAGATDGRDLVDGGAGTDIFDVDGNATAETYRLYTRVEALAAGLTSIAANTEIVITRNGTTNAQIIAELDNIEEINLNAAGGIDTIAVIGDFSGTSLALNTITIRGSVGDDVVDISALQSDHRIVFKSLGGDDVILGVLRPEDVIELPVGSNLADYVSSTVNGVTTLSNGINSVSYDAAGQPQIVVPDSLLDLSQGDNVFYASDEMTSDTQVTGTAGVDVLVLQGDYDLTLNPNALVDIEYISLQSGTLDRFGQSGANLYNFSITTVDDNVGADELLVINAQSLRAGENFTFNGSAETDGRFLIYAGYGAEDLTGGGANDIFFFEAGRFGSEDKVNGGAGPDSVVIAGIEPGGANPTFIHIGAGTFTGIEALSFNGKFASAPEVLPSYEVVLEAGNIAAGETLIVNASSLASSQFVLFDASSETAGSLEIYGSAGADTVLSGSQADLLYAGGGADTLSGGGGADRFQYRSASDSTVAAADRILDFSIGEDAIDLAFMDANTNVAGDQGFTFVGSAAFSQAAGELRAQYDALTQEWAIEGDLDGNGTADFRIVAVTAQPDQLGAGDFIL